MDQFLNNVLTVLFSTALIIGIAGVIGLLMGGPAMAFRFLGFFTKLISLAIKIVFMVITFVVRRVFFVSKDYVRDENNKTIVWNATAITIAALCLWYLFGTFRTIYEVYTWQNDGWLVLGVIGLASIRGSYIISNAPIMKKTSFTKEWSSVLADGICGLTFASALVNLELYFLHDYLPKYSMIAALVIYLAFLAYIVVKLTDSAGGNTILDKFEDAEKRANEGGSIIQTRDKADLHVANTKPSLAKPKSEEMIVPEVSRYQHTQTVGPTGTGKSILLNNMAVQDVNDTGIGVIVLEPTKDVVWGLRAISRKVGRKYYFIDPTDPESDIINPLDGDEIDDICVMNVRAFSGYLGKNANQFYKEEQENALEMAIKVAKAVKGDEATYEDLRDIVRPMNKALRAQYLKQIADPDIRNDLAEFAEMFEDKNTAGEARRNYQGLNTYLKKLTGNKHLRRMLCSKSTVKLKDLFEQGDVLLMTTDYPKLSSLGFVLGRLNINMIQTEIFHRASLPEAVRDASPPMAVYVDEVQNYVSEPFVEIFEMARKCKTMMHIFHQGLAQLREISERLADGINDNTRQKFIFGGTNIEDCKMFSDKIGQAWKNVKTFSQGVFNPLQINDSSREELRVRMRPEEIYNLPGFNTKTFEPAEVLCLLVIHNVIQDAQIGLIGPLPKHIFRDSEKMIQDIIDRQADRENNPEVASEIDSPTIDSPIDSSSDESQIVNYTKTDEEKVQDGIIDEEVIEGNEGSQGEPEPQTKRKPRRKRGGSKNSKNSDNGSIITDEETLVLNDMHEQSNQSDEGDQGLTDDEMLLLMHDDDKG